MPMTAKKIESEALNLDIQDRAKLAGKLLLSLEEPSASVLVREPRMGVSFALRPSW